MATRYTWRVSDRIVRPDKLVVDELTEQLEQTRRLLLGRTGDAIEAALRDEPGHDAAELDITADLADRAPLAAPERFIPAHRLALHALEVLDQHGTREPPLPPLGPLGPVATAAVTFVADYIVKSYLASVVGAMRTLYTRREALCDRASPERRMLAQARVEVERIEGTYRGGGKSIPLIVAAGAAVPAVASLGNYLGAIPVKDPAIIVGGLVALFLVFMVLSWVMARGARLARRRSRLVAGQPLAALWETIGRAGSPPSDQSTLIASIAIVLPLLAWFVIPAAVALVLIVT
ncbi:MAG: hypothetical protein Kow0010_24290 [Dehalococcoidia bacterium]